MTDADGNALYEYFWNGKQVSDEEYRASLNHVFKEKDAISIYELQDYSTVAEAYRNLG